MTDNTIYGDFVMAQRTDDFFRWLISEQMPTWADGNTEAPVGWFAVVRPEREDLIAYVQESGDPALSNSRLVKANQWYVVQIDTRGFVYTISYEGLDGLRSESDQRRRALADFNRLTRHYSAWCEVCPTCGQPDNCGDCNHEEI